MAIILASKAPKKRTEPLPSFIEDEINDNITQGIRSWEFDETWEPYKDDIVDNLHDTGWSCKITTETGKNLETSVKMLKLTPKQ